MYLIQTHTSMPLFSESFNKLAPFHTSLQLSSLFIDKIPMIKVACITLSALLILNHGKMYTTVADGNCLFKCYYFQFTDSEGKHMQVHFFFFVLRTWITYLLIQSLLTPTLSMEDAWSRVPLLSSSISTMYMCYIPTPANFLSWHLQMPAPLVLTHDSVY